VSASADKTARPGWFSRLFALRTLASARATESEIVFPPEFIASLERLRLAALKAIGGGLREGHRLGAYKGGQLEFHGHRNYVPGDELRYVDWNSYARLGRPYVKEFAREEAGVLHLLVDATPSMSLGAPSKWTFARRLAALFIHVALASKDVVFVYVFRGVGEFEQFPARGAKGGIREFLAFLTRCAVAAPVAEGRATQPRLAAGALDFAVTQFLRRNPSRGRVIVIGDFWQEESEIVSAVSRLSSAGFDASAIHVLAPEELAPEAEGELLARSLEEEGEIELSGGGDFAGRYAAELEAHRRTIEETFKKRGGNYLLERSDTSIERVLIATLRQRRWVM